MSREARTFEVFWGDFTIRSASMSYLRTLKHSSRSSRNRAYVRTHAAQSQAIKVSKKYVHKTECSRARRKVLPCVNEKKSTESA